MKPNKKQLLVIKEIKALCSAWEQTNDMRSPSHYNLIGEGLQNIEDWIKPDGISEDESLELRSTIETLYDIIKKL